MIGYAPDPSLTGAGTAYDDQEIREGLLAEKARNDGQATNLTALQQDVGALRVDADEAVDALAALTTVDAGLATSLTAMQQDVGALRVDADEAVDAIADLDAAYKSADAALGTNVTALQNDVGALRVDSDEAAENILSLQTSVQNLSALTGRVLLMKKRYLSSATGIAVASEFNAALGTLTELDIDPIGAGASGIAAIITSAPNTTSGLGHGGQCGERRSARRIPFSAGMTMDVVCGAGGPRFMTVNAPGANDPQFAGGNSSFTLRRSDGTVVRSRTALGGRTHKTLINGLGSSASYSDVAIITTIRNLPSPIPSLPGHGIGTIDYGANAQSAEDAPTSGGGSRYTTSGAAKGGAGGDIGYTDAAPLGPSFQSTAGGTAPAASTGVVDGGAGQNPAPNEAGSFGSGGAGSTLYYSGGVYANGNGGDGATPGGGGGGSLVYTPSSGTDTGKWAGKGGDGAVDVYFYGIPKVAA